MIEIRMAASLAEGVGTDNPFGLNSSFRGWRTGEELDRFTYWAHHPGTFVNISICTLT
jgi:hypothetical protein